MDFYSHLLQPLVPSLIVSALLLFAMYVAVNLHRQFRSGAEEVENVGANRMLPSEHRRGRQPAP